MSRNRASLHGKVLVLGEDDRSFLSVVRSLGRAGLQVHVGWAGQDTVAGQSRYISKVHSIPAYEEGDDSWLQSFSRLLREEHFELVIPTSDATMIPLQSKGGILPSDEKIYLLSDYAFEVTQDKEKTYALAGSLGIPVPRQITISLCDHDWKARILSEIGVPAVFKACSSVSSSDTRTKRTAAIAENEADLESVAAVFQSLPSVLVQSFFPGVGIGVEVLSRHGRVLYAFQHARVHESFGSGSSYRKGVVLDQEMLQAVERMITELNYTGVAMFEFRLNPQLGRWVLLEINGRFWGSLPLAIASGADFPRFLYEMAVDGRAEFSAGYRTGLYCRNFSKDLFWMLRNRGGGKSQHSLSGFLVEAVKNTVLLRERSDTLVLDDPAPAWKELRELAGYMRGKLRGKVLQSPRLRRGFRFRPPRVLPTSRILFVCKGNICRSPFAQQYTRTFYGSVQVASAGYYPASNRMPPETAQEVAHEFGVDVANSTSRVIDAEMLTWADLVLVFDLENLEMLSQNFPQFKRKVTLLSDMAPGLRMSSVSDPYGRDAEQFRIAFRQIATLLDSLLATNGVPRTKTEQAP